MNHGADVAVQGCEAILWSGGMTRDGSLFEDVVRDDGRFMKANFAVICWLAARCGGQTPFYC